MQPVADKVAKEALLLGKLPLGPLVEHQRRLAACALGDVVAERGRLGRADVGGLLAIVIVVAAVLVVRRLALLAVAAVFALLLIFLVLLRVLVLLLVAVGVRVSVLVVVTLLLRRLVLALRILVDEELAQVKLRTGLKLVF